VIESLFAIISLLIPAAVVLYLCCERGCRPLYPCIRHSLTLQSDYVGGQCVWLGARGGVGADYAAGGAGMLSWLVFGLLVVAGFGKRLRWLTEKHPISYIPICQQDHGDQRRAIVTQRHQITIPEEICKKSKIAIGDIMEVSYEHGKLSIEKIDENWKTVMEETRGAWSEHPVFKEMDDAVEIVNWIRGKE